MGRAVRPGSGGRRVASRLAAGIAVALLLPTLGLFPAAGATAPANHASPAGGVLATVTVDGHPTAPATAPSSAIGVSLGGPLAVTFDWHATGVAGGSVSAGLATISTARLQLYLFGAPVSSLEVDISNATPAPAGNVTLLANYAYAHYLVGGVYEMEATLLESGGTTAYSEWFYLRLDTPYFVSVASVIAGVVLLWELYAIAELGTVRSARAGGSSESRRARGGGR